MTESVFYSKAKDYWEGIEPTVDGMLGGYGHVSSTDIGASHKFLRQFLVGHGGKTQTTRVLDCGAGIGRISKLLLAPIFDEVELVELTQAFLDKAPDYFGDRASKLGRRFCTGLQNFNPDEGHYDVIWCQWVLGHLTDQDLVAFFKRCKNGLRENGIIVLKENICSSETASLDTVDSSYTRPKLELLKLTEKAGLRLLKQEKQKNFPKDLYEVWMFALQ